MLQSKKNFKTQILEIFIIHKHFLGPREVHTKFGAVRFSRFDVYWIQTNKQTDTHTSKVYRLRRHTAFFWREK